MKRYVFGLIFVFTGAAFVAHAKTDAETIAEAVRAGDCAFLYAYTKKADGDPALAATANNTVKRYTAADAQTARFNTNKMDARVRQVKKELMEQVFVDPKAALPGVVSALTAGTSDSFSKAKVLHDWICDNIAYDADMYFSGRISAQDYVPVLKKKKAVCSGYTNLMNKMCELAGIESIGIHGFSKGFGYTGKMGKNTDHEWNAVYINNKWYLVDVTWDAGPMERRTFIKRYSTEWLFLDSRPFLYSHLPAEEKYQFYAPVLTAEDFMREAYIAGKFFQYGLSLKSEKPEYNNIVDGGLTFDIALKNSNVSLSSNLRTPAQENIDAAMWVERKGSIATVDVDVPDTAEYKGHIFARNNNEQKPLERIDIRTFEGGTLPKANALFNVADIKDRKITEKELELFTASYFKVAENGYYYFAEDQFDAARNAAVLKMHTLLELSTGTLEPVLDFNIQAASGYAGFGVGVLKYPYTFGTYSQATNTQLISPLTGTLKAGSAQTFVVSSGNYTKFAVIIDGQWNHFTKNPATGNFELTLTIPDGIDTLAISASSGTTYWSLLRYNVE